MIQMARFEHYEPCPRCRKLGKDTRGDNLAVYSDGGKHCFSCGFHVFPRYYTGERQREERVNAAVLPSDFSREVPSHALKWLLQYHLPYTYWAPFIGWSEKDSRLIITVGDNFAQGRFIKDDHWSGPEPRKWFSYGDAHKHAHIIGDYSKASKIVLVEDIVSAHKVGTLVPTIPLFGTNIFDACIPVLRFVKLPITLWLDKDQSGTMARKCDKLALFTGLPVNYVVTDNDPKACSFTKIEEVLK